MINGGLYNKDFQITLTTGLVRSSDFYEEARRYLIIEDLDLHPCALVYESLVDYHKKFNKHPDFHTLTLHVQWMLRDVENEVATVLAPEEHEALAYTLQRIATTPIVDTTYLIGQLPAYVKSVRISRLTDNMQTDLAMGKSVDDFVQNVIGINSDTANNRDIVIESMDETPESPTAENNVARVPTGLRVLDTYTAGGLGRGELGMVTACPGVGKTTSLINFGYSGAVDGAQGLFMTLELVGRRIKHRYHAMAAHIEAGWFKTPMAEWPEVERKRYEYILQEGFKYYNRMDVVDMSTRPFNMNDIEYTIGKWLEAGEAKDKLDEYSTVYLDWLDCIDITGLSKVNRNSRSDEALTELTRSLSMLARKFNVGIWTATQAKQAADGRERLKMSDASGAWGKNFALDIGLGLGVVNQEEGNDQGNLVEGIDRPVCNRELALTLTKNRDNQNTSFELYQGKTLRFWDGQEKSTQAENIIKKKGLPWLLGDRGEAQSEQGGEFNTK